MAVKSTTTQAPTTQASKAAPSNWMRALMLLAAVELGYKHSQTSTTTDVYTKVGKTPVVLHWGSASNGHLLAITQGKEHIEGKGSMLQKAQTKLGKPLADGKKWPAISPSKKADLVAWASKHLVEVAPAS